MSDQQSGSRVFALPAFIRFTIKTSTTIITMYAYDQENITEEVLVMRKYMAIAVMICLSALLLVGCGGSGDKNVKEQSEAKAQPKADVRAAGELPSQTDGYVIMVKDADTEDPLAGVRVQFCSDSECRMGVTDDTGTAVFKVDPGKYEAHILKPPAGYQKNKETVELTEDNRIAVFTLLKAE